MQMWDLSGIRAVVQHKPPARPVMFLKRECRKEGAQGRDAETGLRVRLQLRAQARQHEEEKRCCRAATSRPPLPVAVAPTG